MSTNTDWDAIADAFDLIEDADFIQEFEDRTWISVNSEDYRRVLQTIRTQGEDLCR